MTLSRKRVPRIRRLRRELSRDDVNRVVELLNERARLHERHDTEINELRRELQTQFTRIAQLQHEIDQLKKRM